MTIQASGTMRTDAIRAEYGGGVPMRLGNYRRGHGSMFVRANSGDNEAVNRSAGVPDTTQPLRMSSFYSQGIGWYYVNVDVRYNNYYPHGHFGSDWLGANGTNWPCEWHNNNGIYATSNGYYAMIIYARQNNGPCSFTNNSEIQGGGGDPNSGAGQHAIYLYNSESASYGNRPIIYNNYAIRGGGGAGGIGGTGGTGGQGYYGYTAQEGPAYQRGAPQYYVVNATSGVPAQANQTWYWAGGQVAKFTGSGVTGRTSVVSGNNTFYRHTLRNTDTNQPPWTFNYFEIYVQYPANAYGTPGGGGGGGGNGGQGIGYGRPNTGGAGGAPGAGPGGANAGSGGYGGTGGTGGSWGENGQTGATGATGNTGNYTGGTGGAAGAGGGAAGGSVYAASQWGFANNNTAQGPWWYGVGNS